MPINLKNTIFARFFSLFDKEQDDNKDVDGKGTIERYQETIGEDVDLNVIPFIDNAHDNLIVPQTMFERYIIDRENSLGNNVLFLGFSTEMRRRIIKHWIRYVNIKGTIRCYEVLFSMLGITGITITELFDTGGFDSITTFDSDIRPTFDSGKCSPCTFYSIELVGPPLTTEIYNAIFSIIMFNEPINAKLLDLTYNGLDLLNIVTNFTYITDIIGTHAPVFTNNGPTLFFEFVPDPAFIVSDAPSKTYLNAGNKTVNLLISDFSEIKEIDMTNQQLVGLFDLTNFTALTAYKFSGNPKLNDAGTFSPNTEQVTNFEFKNTVIPTFDLSDIDNLGGIVDFSDNSALTAVTFAAAKTGNFTTFFDISNTIYVGALDLEPLTLGNLAIFRASNINGITSISLATTVNNGTFSEFTAENCDVLGTFDFSALRGEVLAVNVNDCTSLTTLDAGTGFAARTSNGTMTGRNTSSLTGTLDLSTYPIGGIFDFENTGLTDITHITSNDSLSLYRVKGSANLIYYSITAVNGILGEDDAVFDVSDCGLTQVDVDKFLNDLAIICITNRGETAPGSFTGREVYIDGSNAAPSAGGLASIAQLNSIGITVFNN